MKKVAKMTKAVNNDNGDTRKRQGGKKQMAGMTHEEMLKQTREFMKKLNSRPMPESVKWEIERLEAIESGEYAKTPGAIQTRKEIEEGLNF